MENIWPRATEQFKNFTYKWLATTKAFKIWFSCSHNSTLASGIVFHSACQVWLFSDTPESLHALGLATAHDCELAYWIQKYRNKGQRRDWGWASKFLRVTHFPLFGGLPFGFALQEVDQFGLLWTGGLQFKPLLSVSRLHQFQLLCQRCPFSCQLFTLLHGHLDALVELKVRCF